MKTPTLHDLMEHHGPYMRRLAEQHQLGPLQSRGVQGEPRDAARTAIVTYRFERGSIVHRDGDYHIEKAVD